MLRLRLILPTTNLESLEIVNEYIWNPKILYEVEVYRGEGVICCGGLHPVIVGGDHDQAGDQPWLPVLEEVWVDVQSRLSPLDIEIEAVGDGEVPVIDDQDVANVYLYLDQVCLHKGKSGGQKGLWLIQKSNFFIILNPITYGALFALQTWYFIIWHLV